MYGWRARIGLLVPHVSAVIEPECWRLAPRGVSFHTARVRVPATTVEGLLEMEREVERAAAELADLNAAVICYCCNASGFIEGGTHETETVERIQRAAGTRTVSAASATLEALHSLGATRVAVATPYRDEINEREVGWLEANGLRVTAIRGLGLGPRQPVYPLSKKPVSPIALLEPSITYNLARDVMTPDAEAVLISCANIPTLDVLEPLEQDLGVPVVSSNQATFWLAMRVAGIRARIEGYGSLLRGLAPGMYTPPPGN